MLFRSPGENGIQGIQGEQGIQGFSAYEIAVQNGFTGTAEEWLASLKGDKGDTGGVNSISGQQGDLLLENLLPQEKSYKEIIAVETNIITLPFWYKAGANMLRVLYNTEELEPATDFEGLDGYYLEISAEDTIAEKGTWSNKIQCNEGWTWLPGVICKVYGKGVQDNDPTNSGNESAE